MKFQLIFMASLAALCLIPNHGASAKVFGKCELAKELVKQGISRASLPDWMCLVQSESSRNTARVGGPNRNKSKDWGLFQINDKYWCKDGQKGGDCNINCRSLVNDDISDDVRCAKIIFKRHGYSAWYGWQNKCKGKQLESMDKCF